MKATNWITVFGMSLALMAPAAHADLDGMMMEDLENKVFVLKHPDPAVGAAFVRASDTDRLNRLVAEEGYEVVMRRNEDGSVQPVLGETLPEEFAEEEAARVSGIREERDMIDIGVGLNVGLTTGGKARILGVIGDGLIAGVDLDVGTILFISNVTVSGIIGWEFRVGDHALRPYLTAGGGRAFVWAILAAANGNYYQAGAGFEWKPAKWFGLGIEGGVAAVDYDDEENTAETAVLPWGRLNVMFYFR